MKKLSIITVCYNDKNLERTCQSIVNQSWQEFEWIVIDGASNEDTQKIWDKYKYRIDKFISEPDNGIYDAMNKGIKLAQGEYLDFMNAGDTYYYNDVLRDIFANNQRNEDILYGIANIVYNNGKESLFTLPKDVNKEYFKHNTISHQGTFIKRELFEKYGDYSTKYISGDLEKWLKFASEGCEFKYIPYIVTNFYTDGISQNPDKMLKHQEENEEIKRKYFTENELAKLKKNNKNAKTNLLYSNTIEKIFSVKNTQNKDFKVLTLFGLKIFFENRCNNRGSHE